MEVPEGVGWDRKRSSEPNLHVYGEDGIKRAVYNMKESIEEDRNIKKGNREHSRKKLKNQRTVLISKRNKLSYQC